VEKGTFRQDLFFRLNVIPIYIPPLRERREDIPILLLHFLRELDAGNVELEDDAVAYLESYDWPGNVRELRNLAERIVVMYTGNSIGAWALKNLVEKNPAPEPKGSGGLAQTQDLGDILNLGYGDAKESFEKQYLEFQFAKNGGVIARTAEAIGIYPSNLHAKLRKYNIRTDK
jgi:two-component system nitrogen regulation response regulator NtrX